MSSSRHEICLQAREFYVNQSGHFFPFGKTLKSFKRLNQLRQGCLIFTLIVNLKLL